MLHTVEIDLDGQKITLETGKIARQANGAVVVRSGETVVLVSAFCSSRIISRRTAKIIIPAGDCCRWSRGAAAF